MPAPTVIERQNLSDIRNLQDFFLSQWVSRCHEDKKKMLSCAAACTKHHHLIVCIRTDILNAQDALKMSIRRGSKVETAMISAFYEPARILR
jgi:hypothetical protein